MSEPETPKEQKEPHPLLRVVSGDPTPDELAALLTVLAARSSNGRGGAGAASKRSLWAARSRQVRPAVGPGPGAWRASSLPR